MKTQNIFSHIALMSTTLIALTACEKEPMDLNAELTMQYEAIEVTLDPMEATGYLELAVDFNGREAIDEALASNGMDQSNLKEVRILAARITIVEPTNSTFAPLNSFAIQLGHVDGVYEAIASIGQVDATANVLDLAMSGSDLVQYFTSEGVAAKLLLDLGMPITETMKFKVDLTFKVVAGTL